MRVILIGYPGSQFLVPASRFLTEKYLPGFHVQYLNHVGPTSEWSKFLREELEKLDDEFVIFALDDYLLSSPIHFDAYENALRCFDDGATCVKLFRCTDGEHAGYPVTTQYTIWRRSELVDLLSKTTTPWDFEMSGSRLFMEAGKKSVRPALVALEYFTNSSLSNRWQGVRLYGLNAEDSAEVQKLIDQANAGQK